MDIIWTQIVDTSVYQWLAVVFSLVYIFLAIQNKPVCFLFGFVSSLFWAYESYFLLNLKFDAGLQAFYLLMSIWGIYHWKKGNNGEEAVIHTKPLSFHLIIITAIVILGILLAAIIGPMLSTNLPYLDAITTVALIFATVLLVRRNLENWIYFIVADMTYIYIYGNSGAWLFVLIMLIYTVMAFVGLKQWRQEMRSI